MDQPSTKWCRVTLPAPLPLLASDLLVDLTDLDGRPSMEGHDLQVGVCGCNSKKNSQESMGITILPTRLDMVHHGSHFPFTKKNMLRSQRCFFKSPKSMVFMAGVSGHGDSAQPNVGWIPQRQEVYRTGYFLGIYWWRSPINCHFRNLNWRYLPYIRPI